MVCPRALSTPSSPGPPGHKRHIRPSLNELSSAGFRSSFRLDTRLDACRKSGVLTTCLQASRTPKFIQAVALRRAARTHSSVQTRPSQQAALSAGKERGETRAAVGLPLPSNGRGGAVGGRRKRRRRPERHAGALGCRAPRDERVAVGGRRARQFAKDKGRSAARVLPRARVRAAGLARALPVAHAGRAARRLVHVHVSTPASENALGDAKGSRRVAAAPRLPDTSADARGRDVDESSDRAPRRVCTAGAGPSPTTR